jgi:hypothetical protein
VPGGVAGNTLTGTARRCYEAQSYQAQSYEALSYQAQCY